MSNSPVGFAVEPAAIERSLRQLLENDASRSRASLINLVVCSEEKGSLQKNAQMLEKITREHACRAIVVEFDRTIQEPTIQSWVTAHCHLGANGKKALCSEQIAYLFTGWVEGRFQSTVFAHALSDLPLVFWWQGALTPMFTERLSSVVDRLIVDSAEFTNIREDFATILAAVNESALGLVFQDLAWARSWQFRNAIAALFDDQATLSHLADIESIEIECKGNCRVSALQLLAWFGMQAGFTLIHGGDSPRFRSPQGREVSVVLRENPSCCGMGYFRVNAGEMQLDLSCVEAGRYMKRVRRIGASEVVSHGVADGIETAALVEGILARGGKNSLYRRMIPHFLALLA